MIVWSMIIHEIHFILFLFSWSIWRCSIDIFSVYTLNHSSRWCLAHSQTEACFTISPRCRCFSLRKIQDCWSVKHSCTMGLTFTYCCSLTLSFFHNGHRETEWAKNTNETDLQAAKEITKWNSFWATIWILQELSHQGILVCVCVAQE